MYPTQRFNKGCSRLYWSDHFRFEDMYKANKTRAIGVSNYCQSCLECLEKTMTM